MGKSRGVAPIVTIIIVLAFIIAGFIVFSWAVGIHLRAVKRPLLKLGSGVYISGNTVFFTLQNDGEVAYNGSVCVVIGGSSTEYCTSVSIPPGGSRKISISGVALPAGATSVEVLIRTETGELRDTADILRG